MTIYGEVTERNDELADFPEKVKQDPYGDGWMLKISTSEGSNLNHLLDSQSYQSEVG